MDTNYILISTPISVSFYITIFFVTLPFPTSNFQLWLKKYTYLKHSKGD